MKRSRASLAAMVLASAITVCLTMMAFPGCQKETGPAGIVTLYTSVPEAIIEELRQEFEAENPAMSLDIYREGTSAVLEKINEEIAAGQVQADVIWVADFAVGEDLKDKGVLLSYVPPEAVEIPGILKDEDGYYYAGRLLIMVVAYNTDTVLTEPVGYKDLLDKRYHGRIGHDTPETSGSLRYFVGTLLQDADFGEEFFTALAGNSPQIQTSTKTTQRIASGELDMGITIDFTVRKLLKEGPAAPIDYIYPGSGVVMVPSPIAIFRDSQSVEAAKVFERYVLSKKGQTVLRDLGGFVPVRLDVSPPERITTITQLKVIPSDRAWIAEHEDEIVSKFTEIFGRRED
jgi:iron(III) transport system substrate-binding protein